MADDFDYKEYKKVQASRFSGSDITIVQKRLKTAYKFFKPIVKPQHPVLDLGTRDGWFVEYLTKKGFKDIQGVELNKEAVKWAQSQGRNVIAGDMHDLSMFPPNHYHTILSIHSLEHCYDVPKVVDGFHRLLVPGGVLYIEVPREQKANRKMAHFTPFSSPEIIVEQLGDRFETLKQRVDHIDKNIYHILSAHRKHPNV